jgi:pyruvate kinase
LSAGGATRRVKVMATLGPASGTAAAVRELIEAGADAFRLNAAHLQPAEIAPLVELVRSAERGAGRPIAVLCDLAGPKLRVCRDAPAGGLTAGGRVTVGDAASGAALRIEGFDPASECPIGSRVLVHDGKVALRVVAVEARRVTAEVLVGGEVSGGMGVNLPDVATSLPALTAHDLACLEAAVAAGSDAVSLSFVRRGEQVEELRRRSEALGAALPIVAKIEKAQAVEGEALPGILAAADMVIVARGDLGAETAPERVPVLQKEILRAARQAGVPAITATELLESMLRETRPTRAEAADVANAVFDGSDGLLLTAETAIGAHPALAVAACARIAREAEANPAFRTAWSLPPDSLRHTASIDDAVAAAAVVAAEELEAVALVCFTTTGRTARLVSRHRPSRPLLALTPSESVARALAMVWGIRPCVSREVPADHEAVVRLAEEHARRLGLARPGDVLVITHGAPLGARGATNLVRVHRVQ